MIKQKKQPGRLRRLFSFTQREVLFMALGGLGLFLGLPNPLVQVPPLMLLFPLAVSLLALEASGEGRAVRATLGVTLPGGSLAVHWLVYPMINYGSVPLPLAVCFTILLVALLSVYYIIYSLFLRFYAKNLPRGLVIPAAALTWGGLEYLRGWLFTGVTWCGVSSAMTGWPLLAQGAALVGMFGLSTLYALGALYFLPLLARGTPRGRAWPQAAAGALILAALAGYGYLRLEKDFAGEAVIIAQAQGNIEQAQKWLPGNKKATVEHYLRLSRRAIDLALAEYGQKPDLMVWPETSMPFYYPQPPELGRPVSDFFRMEGVPLAFGAPARGVELGSPASYNRLLLLGRDGAVAASYDKEHLVPLGEYIPKGVYVPFASEFLQGYGFTPGRAEGPLGYRQFRLGALICYEAIFPELAQARVAAGANLLVNVSNDAWFADSPAPYQHLQLSAMRCIEQGRWMIRSTNTGLSAMIDPAGRILGLGPLFEPHASVHRARLLEGTTFFHRHYAVITGITAYAPLACIALGLLCGLLKRNKGKLCNNLAK